MADAGRRAIQRADSIEQLTEFNRDTLKSAETANRLAIYGQQRIGELFSQIPKVQGKRSDVETLSVDANKVKPKSEVLKELGFRRDQVSDYESLAKNPEVVEAVLKEAQASGKIVSMAEMQRRIKDARAEGRKAANNDYQADLQRARNEAAAARSELSELRNQTEKAKSQQRLLDYSYLFCNTCYSFLKEAGGLGFIAEQIMDLPPKELANYKKAVFDVLAWAQYLCEFIGG